MKKLLLVLFAIICLASCSSFEDKTPAPEKSPEPEPVTKTLVLTLGDVNYSYAGALEEDIVYDEITLTATGSGLTLGESCLGVYANHAKKVIVGSMFTDTIDSSFSEDSVLEELVFENDNAVLAQCCCYGCTALGKIIKGTTEITQDGLKLYTE